MTDETNESYLSLRIPSNENDEKFISGINSSYEAAKLRSASKDAKTNQYHSPVKFSWKDFWKTMIYENLPPVIFSPIASLFLEKSLSIGILSLIGPTTAYGFYSARKGPTIINQDIYLKNLPDSFENFTTPLPPR